MKTTETEATLTNATTRPCIYCGDPSHEAKEASNTCLAYLKDKLNSHEALVKALTELTGAVGAMDTSYKTSDWLPGDKSRRYWAALEQARTALQLVKGGE